MSSIVAVVRYQAPLESVKQAVNIIRNIWSPTAAYEIDITSSNS